MGEDDAAEAGTSQREDAFALLLRDCRGAANLTQEELAERSGLSVHTISMLERGVRRTPRATTLELLAAALQLDPERRRAFVAAARGRSSRGELPERAPPVSWPPEPRAGIPPEPGACFVGRQGELAALARNLRLSRQVAVHGLGGVGKTQLVVRHIDQHRAEYPDGVFWLRADEEASLVGDLAGLAWRLGLPERALPEQERQVEAVLRWLREHPRWLLVLDNLEPVATGALRHWLPPGLPGHLLLTSRMPMWTVRLELEPLPVDLATRFLLERTGQADGEAARSVAETLGCLPLALEQAAAFLEASGRDLASYAELLRTRLLELMEEGGPEGHPRPVATTWQLSFERMDRERPAAGALLRLCAFLAPDDIPIGVLQAGAAAAPRVLRRALEDDLELDRAIASLRRYSLMHRHGDWLRVHRLVQAVMRGSLDARRQRSWLVAAIQVLRAGFPEARTDSPEYWPLCARLQSHVQVVDRLAADLSVAPRPLGWLLDRIGIYLCERGEFGLATAPLERALDIRERTLDPLHADTAKSLDSLGWLRRERSEPAAARALLTRALRVRERVVGPDHIETAESRNNLANLLMDMGELAAARPLHEHALAIRERARGPDHPDTAESLSNLANALMYQGQLAAAAPLFERALDIRERAHGPNHPSTAASLSGLGILLWKQGELGASRPCLERALVIHERTLGHDHPRTGMSLHNLAALLRDQGELGPAGRLSERAVATLEAWAPENPWTVQARALLRRIEAEADHGRARRGRVRASDDV